MLKALPLLAFNEVPLARIVGLVGWRNPELARIATDLAAELPAASRAVPDDLALVAKGPPA